MTYIKDIFWVILVLFKTYAWNIFFIINLRFLLANVLNILYNFIFRFLITKAFNIFFIFTLRFLITYILSNFFILNLRFLTIVITNIFRITLNRFLILWKLTITFLRLIDLSRIINLLHNDLINLLILRSQVNIQPLALSILRGSSWKLEITVR